VRVVVAPRLRARPAPSSLLGGHRRGGFPSAHAQRVPGSFGERAGSSSPDAGPVRVLVVDDEPSIRSLCRVNLELAGLQVAEAEDGVEALALIRRGSFDLVLLDVMMPRLDGWQVAEELAADESTRDLPIVFLSARAERRDLEHGFDRGAVGYVAKPFDPLPLAGYLERILERLARGEREALRSEILEGE
jgi:CheY-like chemotaxis protein